MLIEDVWVEVRRSRYPRKLVHPVIRRGWKRTAPRSSACVKQVDIPGRSRRTQHLSVGVPQPAAAVPILTRAPVSNQRHSVGDIVPLSAKLRYPDEVGGKRRVRFARQNRFLNFERPPKTEPSSRTDERDDAHPIGVTVESRAKRFTVPFDIVELCGR